MIQILSQIKNAYLLGNASDVYTEAKIMEILALQLQQNTYYQEIFKCSQLKNINEVEKKREAKSVLIADLKQSPTIPELSKHVGINESKLKYGFKEVYNTTIHQYLFEYKMDLARKLLIDTNFAIFEIAHQCGYDEPAYFSNAFKRKFGMYPREFRSRN
ncbi:helix-turn-helix transcriptional regulator [Marinifilum sp.]|uniref:helix-turn-helix transcriptional regulator n=1 Tax=Marinifilum sp. TaxID=2033137 RepID=UPI003BA88734